MKRLGHASWCMVMLFGSVQGWTQVGTITSLSNKADLPSTTSVGGTSDEECAKHVMLAASSSSQPLVEARNETIKLLPNGPVNIAVDSNVGILIKGSDGQNTRVKICTVSSAQNSVEAEDTLKRTLIMIRPGLIQVAAPHPSHGSFAGLVLVSVPNGTKVTSSAVSGGISIDDIRAEVDAKTLNGGISVHNAEGLIKGESTNGGIYVELPNQWVGQGLDLHSDNGGATVELGTAFNAPLEISTDANTPFSCTASICALSRRNWGDRKTLALGNDPAIVRVSTVRGGVTVKDSSSSSGNLGQ